ncbi:hypothetical protein KIS4809_3124 [Bacillus sp. ZZV12-4809]|nr:hypothetical protein KIS4809_3124 [Bacillus sp. ZZV12-4809]
MLQSTGRIHKEKQQSLRKEPNRKPANRLFLFSPAFRIGNIYYS